MTIPASPRNQVQLCRFVHSSAQRMDAFVVRKTDTSVKLPRPGQKRQRSGGDRHGRSTEVVDVLDSDSEASHPDAQVPRRKKKAHVTSSSSSGPGAFAIMMKAAREKPTEFHFGLKHSHEGKATIVLLPASAGQAKWSSKMKLSAKIAGTRQGAVVNLWTDCPARSVSEPIAGSTKTSTSFSSGQLKSLLQKCIRRGYSSAASRCVYEMWQHGDPMVLELSRRLPIVCIEDVLAQPGMAAAVWLAAAISKGYKPVAYFFLPLLAGLAHSAASCPVHDPIDRYPAAEDASRVHTLYNGDAKPCSAGPTQKSAAEERMQAAEGRSRSLCDVSLVALQHRFGLLEYSTAASGGLTRPAYLASSSHALEPSPSGSPRLQPPAAETATGSSSSSSSASSSQMSGSSRSTAQRAPAQADHADAKSMPPGGSVRPGRDSTGAALCFALLLRRALGGMRGDMAMLAGAQRTWQLRLACSLPEPARASKNLGTSLDGLRLSLEPPPWVRHESAAGGRDSRDLWCSALYRLSGYDAATKAGCSTSWPASLESKTADRLSVVLLPRVVDLGGGVRKCVEAGCDSTSTGDTVSQHESRSSASTKAPSTQAASVAASGPHSAPLRIPRFESVVAFHGLDCHCSRVLDGALVELGRYEAATSSHEYGTKSSGAVLDKEQYSRAMWVFWSGLNVRRSLLGEWAPVVTQIESSPVTKGGAVSQTTKSSGAVPASVFGRRHVEALQAHYSWASGSATSQPLVRMLHDGPFDVLHSIWPRSDSGKTADPMDRDAASALSGSKDVAERVRLWAMWRRVLPFVERQAQSLMRRKASV